MCHVIQKNVSGIYLSYVLISSHLIEYVSSLDYFPPGCPTSLAVPYDQQLVSYACPAGSLIRSHSVTNRQ